MKNRIDVSVEFSFKGDAYKPALSVDLDTQMERFGTLPDFHRLLANANQIDNYSYLYEVMEAHELDFENATGLAAECVEAWGFDKERFEQLWLKAREHEVLNDIARHCLGVDDLAAQPELKHALIEAYEAGKNAR